MGWAGGSEILEEVLSLTIKFIPKNKRKKVCEKLIETFEGHDCDTIQECFDKRWPELEEVYREMYPQYFEEDE